MGLILLPVSWSIRSFHGPVVETHFREATAAIATTKTNATSRTSPRAPHAHLRIVYNREVESTSGRTLSVNVGRACQFTVSSCFISPKSELRSRARQSPRTFFTERGHFFCACFLYTHAVVKWAHIAMVNVVQNSSSDHGVAHR